MKIGFGKRDVQSSIQKRKRANTIQTVAFSIVWVSIIYNAFCSGLGGMMYALSGSFVMIFVGALLLIEQRIWDIKILKMIDMCNAKKKPCSKK